MCSGAGCRRCDNGKLEFDAAFKLEAQIRQEELTVFITGDETEWMDGRTLAIAIGASRSALLAAARLSRPLKGWNVYSRPIEEYEVPEYHGTVKLLYRAERREA